MVKNLLNFLVFILINQSGVNIYASSTDLEIEEYSDEYVFLGGLLNANTLTKEIKRLSPKRVLFLGDQELDNNNYTSLAKEIAQKFQNFDIEFFKTDLKCKDLGYVKDANYYEKHVDNTKIIPFKDDFFDLIIGRRIMCQCTENKPSYTCGGVNADNTDEVERFLTEVSRVLNKQNENCLAFIQGSDHGISVMETYRTSKVFGDVLEKIKTRYPALKEPRQIFKKTTFSSHLRKNSNSQHVTKTRRFGVTMSVKPLTDLKGSVN